MGKFFTKVPTFKSFCLNEGFDTDEYVDNEIEDEENAESKDDEELIEGKTYRENYKSHKNKLDGKFSKKMKEKRSGNGQQDSEAYEKYKDYGDDEGVDEGRSYRDYYKKHKNNMDGKFGKKMKEKRSGNGQQDSEAYERYKDYGDDEECQNCEK